MIPYLIVDWALKHFIATTESLPQPHVVGRLLSFYRSDNPDIGRLRILPKVAQTVSWDSNPGKVTQLCL